ncbi:oxidase/Diels-Alderase [Astrocystis sublimbata]|nr:oxidase/Diels-Alderase [Astrocystis sublimbata]
MRLSWAVILATSALAHASLSVRSVDRFLKSLGIDPSGIPHEVKTQGGSVLACAALASGGNDSSTFTSQKDGSAYIQQAQAHWQVQMEPYMSTTADKDPLCISSPKDINQLRTAVLVSNFSGTQFAIRSGGHSPLPNWASIDGGLLISMININDLAYDATAKTQRSGMGNRWRDVYTYLTPYKRTVVGGRLGQVGLGLATGGNSSLRSLPSIKRSWMGSPNIISYEVLLANGTHVVASAEKNPSLYYAAKAGSNNFGIVTHITQRTFSVDKVWGGVMVFPGNASTQFMEAMAEYQAKGQHDTHSVVLPYIGINNDTIISTFAYLKDVERPDVFKPFYDIPAIADQTMIWGNYASFCNSSIDFAVPRWTWAATTLALDKNTYAGLISVFSEFVPRIQNVTGGTLAPMVQPISTSMVMNSRKLGDDPMNVDAVPQLWVGINVGWSLKEDDARVNGIVVDCLAAVEAYTKSRGVYKPFVFLNDAHTSQNPIRSYGSASFSRLGAASRSYDKEQVFQKLVPGGFKLL